MRVAEMLSDLTSLRICDPGASLALVSARPRRAHDEPQTDSQDEDDKDLKRAQNLLQLHADVKVAHQGGVDKELEESREAVSRTLRTLRN